ncbi:MAG: ribonuclease H family protein [Clostridia bacterium]|nr:ribonuclease H family protein [Clostridia bacterium]
MPKKFYAVKNGRNTGIYETWEECKAQVSAYPGAVYKSFLSKDEAIAYLKIKQPSVKAEAVAYVDGSYSHKDKRFSYGAVVFWNGKEYRLCDSFFDEKLSKMRNVAGEIKGAEAAMRFCIENGIKSLDIYHDYEGIAKWCTGDWKTNKDGTKKYAEFYEEAKKSVNINFVKVKGHSGDRYNDMADMLAKKALGKMH